MNKIVFILATLTVLFGCKSKQQIPADTPKTTSACKLENITKADVIKYYKNEGVQFNWLKVKTKINTTIQDKSVSFTASFRIKKDSLIYASITKSGIPFAKVLVTKDSVKIVDLFHKKYKQGSFEELNNLIGFELPFPVLQNFLFSQPSFLYEDSGIVVADSLLTLSNVSDVIKQENSFPCDTLNLLSTTIDYGTKEIIISNKNPNDINGFLLNKNITLTVMEIEKVIVLADIEIQRIKKFNQLNIPFSIPTDYEKMD